MNISNSEIRAKAREALGNNIFGRAYLMPLAVLTAISAILAFASSITYGIGTYIIAGPLTVGLCASFLKLVRNNTEPDFGTAFSGLNNFVPNFKLGFMLNLYVTLWSLLFIIPGIVKSYSYAMAYYVQVDHPDYDWRECLLESERLMSGNRMRLFTLQLSFIGWMIVGSLCLGVGTLWVSTYMQTAEAIFYEEITRERPHAV